MLKKETEFSVGLLIKATFSNLLVFLVISALIIFTLSLIFFNFDNATYYIPIIGKISLFVSCFTVGIIQSKRIGERSLMSGLFLGTIIALCIFLISLLMPSSIVSRASLLWYFLVPIATALGSFLCRQKETQKKRTKFHKHK